MFPCFVPAFIPVVVEFEGKSHVLTISSNCTWQEFGPQETSGSLSDPSIPGSRMDTPHEIVHAFMVDSVVLPDASENLRKESFPITTLRTPIEDDILDIRMERSENNPKMFPNASFSP